MLTINKYVRAESLEEAYTLCQKRNNVVLGGMLWLKMQKKTVSTAIDLSSLGLDNIEEYDEKFEIGAMVTLRDLEMNKSLNDMTNGAIAKSLKDIVGVQFRNCATVGGSVFGRFGFSDVLCILMSLNARVRLYKAGEMSISDFCKMPLPLRDILTHIIIPKTEMKVAYRVLRNSRTDFPVINCAVSYMNDKYTCVIGARPTKATLVNDENEILKNAINADSINKYCDYVLNNIELGSNLRASKEYRKELVKVFVKRCLLEIAGGDIDAN